MEPASATPAAAPMARTASGSARASLSSTVSASQAPSTAFGAGMFSPTGDAGFGLNGLIAVLRLLKLVDKASGLCLFSAQWKWHPHAHVEGVDALVQSLAQFAREIDGGDVVRVHFDSHVSRGASNSIGNGNASAGSNNGSLTPTQPKAAPEDERRPSSVGETGGTLALEMLSHHHGPIQGVLFHDRVSEITTQRLRVFVEQVVERFIQLHHNDIDRLQPATAAHQAALTAEETAQLVAPFASFEDVFYNELVTTL